MTTYFLFKNIFQCVFQGNLLEYCKYDELESKRDLNDLVSSSQLEKTNTESDINKDKVSEISSNTDKNDESTETNSIQKSESLCKHK